MKPSLLKLKISEVENRKKKKILDLKMHDGTHNCALSMNYELNCVTVTVVTVKIKTVDNSQLTIINCPHTLSIMNFEL